MTARLYADIHIIQSLPPSNVNRDDTGSPKYAEFGGTKRARISSQSQKRHARKHFASHLPEADRATRTLRVNQLLTDRLTSRGADPAVAARLGTAAVASFSAKSSDKSETSGTEPTKQGYLLFCGYRQIDAMAETIAGHLDDLAGLEGKKLAEAMKKLKLLDLLGENNPAEVALFGRMVADNTTVNVDAAVQVAHAISTHQVRNRFDFYTAIDDENRDNAAAGMIGSIEFNSATYYRYATVGIHQLMDTLSDRALAAETACGFLRGFTLALPTGHQTSFAHHTRPHAVIVALRTDQPVNLVNAFEAAILPRATNGLADASVTQIAGELASVADAWGEKPETVLATYTTPPDDTMTKQFGPSLAFPALTNRFETAVARWLETGSLNDADQ